MFAIIGAKKNLYHFLFLSFSNFFPTKAMEEGNERATSRPPRRRPPRVEKIAEKVESEGEQEELKEMPATSGNTSSSRIRVNREKEPERQKPLALKSALRVSDASLRSEMRKSQSSLRSDEASRQAAPKDAEASPVSHFTLVMNGQIESCEVKMFYTFKISLLDVMG